MKITKDQLKQIIKEEMEGSLMDEGVLDSMKGFATRAIGKLGLGGKSAFRTSEEVTETFIKNFVKALPKGKMLDRLTNLAARGDVSLSKAAGFSNTETAIRRIQALAIQEATSQARLAKRMSFQMSGFIYEVSLARKQKRDPNFSKAKTRLTISNDEEMRRAIAILYSAWPSYTLVSNSIKQSEMFKLVRTPQNPFERVSFKAEQALKDFYQKQVSGRTTTEAAHDTVLAIWAYLTSLKEVVEQNNALFKSTLQATLPKRQLNKALEESKMKITKTQLKQIIKEELESVLEAEPTPPPIAEPRPNFPGTTRSKKELERLYYEALKKYHPETLRFYKAFQKEQEQKYKEFKDAGHPMHMAQSLLTPDDASQWRAMIRPVDFGLGHGVHHVISSLMNGGKMSALDTKALTGEEIEVLTGKTIEQAKKEYKKTHGREMAM